MSSNAPILVVDDDTTLRRILVLHLEALGISADSAADGIEAYKLVLENNYELILMDVEMPNMNGLQAASAIRELERLESRPALPIVAITARGASREQCVAAGMIAYYEKPIQADIVKQIVQEFASQLLDA